ncbi:MAG TPA: SGNH/GDSL hydrolase family protein [Gaiellaceae bacterium]|nr:SGNH/GDSL hydrolase family protein [Gaiellaceae bacterium]
MDRLAAVLLLTAGVLAAAGCGGSGSRSNPGRGAKGSILVAALGDSITAGSPGYDPSHARGKLLGFGSNVESQWEYWAARKHPRLRFRNCGVYGERTDEIARRLAACAHGAQALVVQGGIVDIAQGRPVAAAARNLRRMVERGKELGLRVAVADVPPWNNEYPYAADRIRRLNGLIARLARAEHVPVLPFYRTLDDPERPGRMPGAWTVDGDNPSVAGYRRLGELAFRLP